MKSIFIFLILLLFPLAGWAQNGASKSATIRGTIVDNSGNPLTGANVALQNSSGSTVTGASSDQDGHFAIQIKPGQYVIEVTFVSYKSHHQKVSVEAGKTVDVGKIELQPTSHKLGELVVRGEKSEMTMGFDKRTFNVGKDITSLGGSAVNVLRNVPSISIDINGDISLRGNQSVRILINGHPSRFVGNGIQALRSIPSNLIKKVEVITNPSAKYSAEGTGGIINIILVKDRLLGFNGSASVNTGYPQNHGVSANLNYQVGNFNWFANTSFGYRKRPRSGNSFQRFADPDTSYMYRDETDEDESNIRGNLRLGADYYLTKKQTLTASTYLGLSHRNNDNDITYTDLAYSRGALDGNVLERELRANGETRRRNNYNFNLRYENRINGSQQKLTASARYGISHEPENSSIVQTILEGNGSPQHERTGSHEKRNRFRLNVEYKQPLGDTGKLEAGLRSSTRWNDNSQTVEELQNGTWTPITGYNGNFSYRQNVNSAYVTLGKKLGNFSGELGLRLENTRIRTELKKTQTVNTQNYLNLFPSVFLNYAFNHKNSLQVSYSRRLRRPWSRMLLPYSDYSNSRRQRTGNPKLSPEFSNSFEGGYLRSWEGGSLLTSFYFRHRTGVIEHITEHRGNALVSFPINLATEKAWGIELSANQDIFHGLSLWANMNFYRSDRDGKYQSQIFSSESKSMRARIRLRWDFESTWHLQAALRYRGPHNTTQGRSEGSESMNTGLSHDILNGKARISLGIRDVLDSRNFDNVQTTDGNLTTTDFYSSRHFSWSSRTFTLSFRYFFNSRNHNNPHQPHSRHH